jgi:predicted membrane-bound spermidine synthase
MGAMQFTLYFVFFLSGFCALIYEVAWVRILAFALGNTAQATGCVLAVFMGGLALGALAAGRLADVDKRQLLLKYGLVEIGIGVVALLATRLIAGTPELYGSWCRQMADAIVWLSVLRFMVCAGLLLAPTVLMGATLPLLVSFCAGRYAKPGQFFARLYGYNTLGAVVGSLSATFLGFAYLGIGGTILIAAAINIAIGVAACCLQLVCFKEKPEQSQPVIAADQQTVSEPGALGEPGALSAPAALSEPGKIATQGAGSGETGGVPDNSGWASEHRILCAIAALSGLTALSYEVFWTRLLRFSMPSITYAFTFMVSTFLLGLALGSFIYQRFMADKQTDFAEQLRSFARVQYRSAAACAVSLVVLPISVLIKNKIFSSSINILEDPVSGILAQAFVTVLAILPAATFIGISFPMIGAMAASRSKLVGGAVGTIYGANTLGCVAGSLIASMILVSTVGTYKGFALTILFSVVTGLLAAAAALPEDKGRRTKIIGILVGTVTAVVVFACLPPYKMQVSSANERLLKFSEDHTGSICVIDYPKTDSTLLAINGASYALTIMPCKRYMRLLGHLPVLLHPHPESALNICFGTGTTAGSVAIQPEIKSLDIVDLSPEVLKSARFFTKSNHGVLDNPKVHAQVNDGRNFLLCTQNRYDVITFEPPPPVESGIVNLYTTEFYQLAKSRLKPGGMICQWVPLHEQSMLLWKMLIQSCRQIFPYVSIWEPSTGEALILASTAPIVVDYKQLSDKLDRDSEVKKSLSEVGLGSAAALLSTYAISGDDLDRFIQGVPAVTDDKPALEFFAPYAGKLPYAWELAASSHGVETILDAASRTPEVRAALKPNLEAMHLLRFAYKSPADISQSLHQAASLLPDNAWYQYVKDKDWVLINAYSGSSQRTISPAK